ncbi:MAG: NADP oxidoreductase [Gammaproteobacteria bacterium]|nr:MAG: NADP oxidoreductase [Gammaproteobacteria bacterium]
MADKIRVATASLCGCFGCHMSLLDIDERLVELLKLVELDRMPLTDIKQVGPCDLGIIEGGVANAENVHVLREFREKCKVLVAIGACALNGGLPAMRNHFDLKDCLEEAYFNGVGVQNPLIPNDPEIPLLLDKVRPVHEVVPVDHFLPGCPPSADAIWTLLNGLLAGSPVDLPYTQIHYD